MEQEMQMPQGQPMEEAGRGTDTVMAHLSLGEVVIPRAFLDDPQVMQLLQQVFQAGGADMAEYTVGDPANKINPETGYPEFFKIGKIFKALAPAALAYFAPFASGIGTALGGSILGAGATGASTLGNALVGGAIGGLTGGGIKGALTGAAGGAIGANIGSLGSGEILPWNGVEAGGGGSGIIGSIGKATGISSSNLPSVGGLVGSSGGGSSFGVNNIASALGGLQQNSALNKIKKAQIGATGQQLANLENLNPTDVQNDPGYQFAQQQGEQALNRALGAQGGLFSGRALKEASDFNTGLASKFYGDAYARQASKVGAQNAIYGNQGNIVASNIGDKAGNINQTLANAFGTQVGNYNGGQLTDAQLLQLLRQRGLA